MKINSFKNRRDDLISAVDRPRQCLSKSMISLSVLMFVALDIHIFNDYNSDSMKIWKSPFSNFKATNIECLVFIAYYMVQALLQDAVTWISGLLNRNIAQNMAFNVRVVSHLVFESQRSNIESLKLLYVLSIHVYDMYDVSECQMQFGCFKI